jgi:hypothetical protein
MQVKKGRVQNLGVNSGNGKTGRLIEKLKVNTCNVNRKLQEIRGNISPVTPDKENVIEEVQIRR